MNKTNTNIFIGSAFVNLVLVVSVVVSISYWFILSGLNEATEHTLLAAITLYSIIALGLCAELTKKVSITYFKHKGLWITATLVSIITVMGALAITESNKQAALTKASDSYQVQQAASKDALNQMSQYAHAASYNMEDLEKQLQANINRAGSGKARRASGATYQEFVSKRTSINKKIADLQQYQAGASMSQVSAEAMAGGASTNNNTSANPLLANMATELNLDAKVLINVFYLAVTILLEFAAFYVGGQVTKLKDERDLSEQELLEKQNLRVFGHTMASVMGTGIRQNHTDVDAAGFNYHVHPSATEAPKASVTSTERPTMGFINTNNKPINTKPSVTSVKQTPITDNPQSQGTDLLRLKQLHAYAKSCKNGEDIQCPVCERETVKKNNAIFCSNKGKGNCADEYHNLLDPKRLKAIKRKV